MKTIRVVEKETLENYIADEIESRFLLFKDYNDINRLYDILEIIRETSEDFDPFGYPYTIAEIIYKDREYIASVLVAGYWNYSTGYWLGKLPISLQKYFTDYQPIERG